MYIPKLSEEDITEILSHLDKWNLGENKEKKSSEFNQGNKKIPSGDVKNKFKSTFSSAIIHVHQTYKRMSDNKQELFLQAVFKLTAYNLYKKYSASQEATSEQPAPHKVMSSLYYEPMRDLDGLKVSGLYGLGA